MHMLVLEKFPVHERKMISNHLHQIRMQLELALLDVQKYAHEAPWLLTENTRGAGADFFIHNFESVNQLLNSPLAPGAQQSAQGGQATAFGNQRETLLYSARNQINVAHVGVNVAHESFETLAGSAICVAEIISNGRLDATGV